MENSECLYKLLGISEKASQSEIKSKYRQLSMTHHPDKNGGSPSDLYSKITAAYDILGDPQKRKQYDMSRLNPLDNMHDLFSNFFSNEKKNNSNFNHAYNVGNMAEEFGNIKNLFNTIPLNSMFSFGSGSMPFEMPENFSETLDNMHKHMNKIQTNLHKPEAIVKNITISLKQAYFGCSIPINIKRVLKYDNDTINEEEKIYIDIPQGVDDKEIILIKDKGNVVNNIYKGDVKIYVKIKNETPFKRDGLDLILCKEITLKEALCGFAFETIFLDDTVFKLSNKNGNIISPSFNKCINNMGMKRNDNQGQLIIKFNIIFPNNLDEDKIEKLKSILP